MSKSTIEIEIASNANASLHFYPTDSRLRGRFDARLLPTSHSSAVLAQSWPEVIPGQAVGVDAVKGEAWVRDRLYEPQFQALRRKIEKLGFVLPPERVDFNKPHVATWLFWMSRAVESGAAVSLTGQLPEADTLRDEAKTSRFIQQESAAENALRQLAAQNAALVGAIEQLVKQLAARN